MTTQLRPFTHVLDDTSTMFSYSPYVTPDASSGWQSYFLEFDTNTTTNHFTGFIGGTFALEFYGSSLVLFGTFNGTFDIVLDGRQMNLTTANKTESILFSWNDTTPAQHHVKLVTFPGRDTTEQIVFDNATVTTNVLSELDPPNVVTYESNDNNVFYAGLWAIDNTANARATSEPADVVALNFTGSAIEIFGPTDQFSGFYQINLDDREWVMNSFSPNTIPDAQLFFMSGLPENQNHTITMRKLGDNQTTLSFSRMQVTQFNTSQASPDSPSASPSNLPQVGNGSETQQSSSHNIGVPVIAGSVIGAVAVVLVAIITGFLCLRRRRRAYTQRTSLSSSSSSMPTITPFSAGSDSIRSRSFFSSSDSRNRDSSVPEKRVEGMQQQSDERAPLAGRFDAFIGDDQTSNGSLGSPIRRQPSLASVERLLRLLAFTSNAAPSESLPPYTDRPRSISPRRSTSIANSSNVTEMPT